MRDTLGRFLKGNIPFYKGKHLPFQKPWWKLGMPHPLLGKHHSVETRHKISESHLGKVLTNEHRAKIRSALTGKPQPWHRGKHHSPVTEIKRGQRISPKTEFTSERVKSWWKDPEYRAIAIASRLKNRRPTGPERQLIKIIEQYNLPFKYTGDGSFIIGGLNPDFVNTNNRKVAVDVFGDYWHTLKADRESYTEDGRKAILAQYGWKLIVIWENQLRSMNDEEIVNLIGKEENNG